MPKTTERDLVEEVEELLAKATPGPWHEWQLSPDSDPAQRLIVVAGNDGEVEVCGVVENEDDATLISAAPELLRRLVEEVKTNRETLLALKDCQNKPVCGHCNALLRHATRNIIDD